MDSLAVAGQLISAGDTRRALTNWPLSSLCVHGAHTAAVAQQRLWRAAAQAAGSQSTSQAGRTKDGADVTAEYMHKLEAAVGACVIGPCSEAPQARFCVQASPRWVRTCRCSKGRRWRTRTRPCGSAWQS